MEFTTGKTLRKFIDEDRRNINLPRRLSFGNINNETNHDDSSQLTSARTSCVSPSSSPWTRSPKNTARSPSPPLSYHCLASLHRREGNIYSITATKDFIFTGSSSKRIHAWKNPDCSEIGFVNSTSGDIRAILAYENLLITTHGDHRIRLWDVVSPTTENNFRIKKITTLPKRRRSLINYFPYPKKRKTIHDHHQHKDFISCVAYNDNEKLLYTGSWDQTVKVWKINENKCVDSFIAHEDFINAIVINQEDGCVFTCSCDGTVKIWRRVCKESSHILTTTLKLIQPLSPVNALALLNLSPVCFLYSGSSDGLINCWEKEKISGRYNHVGVLQGHHFAVLCLVTIDDLILSGSEDATIRIWKRDEEDYNFFHSCIQVIDGHHGPVKCLAAAVEINEVNVKCLLVYSASLDQSLKVWRVKVYDDHKVKLDKEKNDDEKLECMDWKVSPVLSPSWVEKKIQGFDL
ncbi:hypothetical protein BUALT_Bualt02G0116700 [Buddleja alternifolia]|uniref:Uncharacterized protein n=1 Tax=Buddleja alternifolia TaxID=168488 RepID=A0AAV6Y672_9LAMI|nr:hypothetical protein BUALT_Bualt02G0116700 [Buddleja alternifolia]